MDRMGEKSSGTAMSIQGGCLCGRVRYQIEGVLSNVDHCHCSMCRKQHGAAFGTYADCEPDKFTWVSGEGFIKIYESASGSGWCFCQECGSTLAGTDNGEITSITLGTVDGDPGVRPESHIFVDSKACWYEICDNLPQHKER